MEQRRLAAIMFTDIVGYTRLMGQDEEKAFKVLENNRGLHKDLLILYDGQLLKEIGDGMLCSFDSASKAVKCGIELIRKSNEYKNLKLRIGIHIGEVVFSGSDVFGDGVNIASRIEAMAIADSVLISEQVYDQIKNKQNIRVKHIGTYELKNDTKPREIYAIANSKLKVPAGKDLHSYTEDKPEQQHVPPSDIKKQEKLTAPKSRLSSPRVGLTLLFSLMAVAFGSFLFISFRNTAKVKWAREEAIIKIEELIEKERLKEAFNLAKEAEKYIPNDPLLNRLWPRMDFHLSMNTDPPGAQVFRKTLNDPETSYKLVGTTPIDSLHTYIGFSNWKLVKEGFDTLEFMHGAELIQDKKIKLFRQNELPEDMLYVPFYSWGYWIPGWLSGLGSQIKPVLTDFLVDKYEVSNSAFKEFIDASGYQNQSYWKESIFKEGTQVSWEEGLALFKDKTGHPGPSTWEIGDFPDGQDDYPVTGISWYEAMAYAEFSGKRLPSVFHWIYAATPGRGREISPYSNFQKSGASSTGRYRGLGMFGTYDMAGNAREWCSNKKVDGAHRFILGGAWDELPYNFSNTRSLDPLDRSSTNGFRCIQYIDNNEQEELILSDLPMETRDYAHELPVDDATFSLFLHDFDYEKTPFEEKVEMVNFGDPDFTCQKIFINSTYNDERLCLYLFLPTRSNGPYQLIFNFPSGWMWELDDFEESFNLFRYRFDFHMKSGRAVAFPIIAGTFDRAEISEDLPPGNQKFKDNAIAIVKDVRRHLDYLELRQDINKERIGYHAFSRGAWFAPLILAVEKRFQAAVLIVGGLISGRPYPEYDPINYLPRTTLPTLMLNGRHDHIFSVETSVKPMFELLGAPPEHKKLLIYETGHTGPTRHELIKESLDWFDTYLGPVKTAN